MIMQTLSLAQVNQVAGGTGDLANGSDNFVNISDNIIIIIEKLDFH